MWIQQNDIENTISNSLYIQCNNSRRNNLCKCYFRSLDIQVIDVTKQGYRRDSCYYYKYISYVKELTRFRSSIVDGFVSIDCRNVLFSSTEVISYPCYNNKVTRFY